MTIVYRQDKGASLTYAELDNNIFELDARVAKPDKSRVGFFDIDDTATASSPINATDGGTWYKITNNGAGPQTNSAYAPEGVTTVWDTANGQFDFNDLALGSQVHIRAILELTTTAVNQEVSFRLRCGIGDGNVYNIPAGRLFFKAAGTYIETVVVSLYMGNTLTRDNPAELQVNSADDVAVEVDGFFVQVFLRGEAA